MKNKEEISDKIITELYSDIENIMDQMSAFLKNQGKILKLMIFLRRHILNLVHLLFIYF